MKVYTQKEFVNAIEQVVLEHWLTEAYGIRPCEIAAWLRVTTQKVGRYLKEARITPVTIGINIPSRDYPNDVTLSRDTEVTAYEPSRGFLLHIINQMRREQK
jgi:hypothetical protein